ncbi:MAG: molybdate ABC transporter substrate-binding protein [Vicinamibacterales bacterium]|jgi:molybdate transport system substrate-binding protein|nr:molybdate ABC transporter substrate-binding protein [Acidobacteriota bacterium]MDP7294606.1 molybdate ABC transporter substrate-binding protein [Vicinamibacterales bacterium]MDP7470987.1 molybdate ABC transporter substrate-binding protein [Vicinamibacterales bacterium]MDP7671629.1 molybdate ABC transporter substrate-binding protein [Vicinamibacterales bacterium]HJO37039.1 molybdate ABC transporter substrate-binding protein [Vicinamibacterales bacterium]|tara:strand:- start:4697 stop:5509 length:813 start_codon:yes stop_codon:yes gene_type:complete
MAIRFDSWRVVLASVVVAAAAVGGGALQARQAEIVRVSAATSLTNVLEEIAREYERAAPGVRIELNIAGSNTLARQIVTGAPVDLFVSANTVEMDRVERSGRVRRGARVSLLSNQLVVVVPDDRIPPSTLADLESAGVRRIALGDPEGVPAGVYARRYLESRGVWATLSSKVVPTRSVRAALEAVEAGNADAAFVYRTDAATAPSAVIAFAVPVDDGPRIVYPVAVVEDGPNPIGAEAFLRFLRGPVATPLFERTGFIALDEAGTDRDLP